MHSQNIYEDYYINQAGNGLPVYSGVATQKGHGLGSILGSLLRSTMPLLSSVGKAVGKQVLKSGLNVASDVISGTNVKDSLRSRAKEGALSLLERAQQPPHKRRRTQARPFIQQRRRKQARRTITSDIFT